MISISYQVDKELYEKFRSRCRERNVYQGHIIKALVEAYTLGKKISFSEIEAGAVRDVTRGGRGLKRDTQRANEIRAEIKRLRAELTQEREKVGKKGGPLKD